MDKFDMIYSRTSVYLPTYLSIYPLYQRRTKKTKTLLSFLIIESIHTQ